ncbi:hypothetical protein ACFWNR_06455 [Streptomyces virginiae]|uniref:hypothetical protein n=1 Tax=Streptomyces virginiae TaxID=1961 RepID=UPI00365ECFB5
MAAAARKDDSKPAPAIDEATAAVQAAFDKAQEQGFYGVEVDPTDNHAYTVAGVTEGAATPETDAAAAEAARRATSIR